MIFWSDLLFRVSASVAALIAIAIASQFSQSLWFTAVVALVVIFAIWTDREKRP